MNKRKSGLQKIKNFRDPPFRTISKSNQNHNTPRRSEKSMTMIKSHEKSVFKRLTLRQIDEANEKSKEVILQIKEETMGRMKSPYSNTYTDGYLCEIVSREEYEKKTQEGQIKELKKKVEDLTEENEQLFCNLQNAERWQKIENERAMKAEKKIRDMEAGFRELERIFGDLPPEIVSLYDIPEIKD